MMNKDLLNDQQHEIFKSISKKFNKHNTRPSIISGHAGTGKTFLATSLVEQALEQGLEGIYLTSPTNQATKNLKSISTGKIINDSRVNYKTIHSFFGLIQYVDGHGKISYKPSKDNKFAINGIHRKTKLLIIDETSMIDSYIYSYVKTFILNQPQAVVIFIGDPYQVPPINEKSSIVFNQKSFDRYVLTKIIRQRETHPIILLADHVRKNIDVSHDIIPNKNRIQSNSVGMIDIFHEQDKLIKLLRNYYESSQKKSSYYCKVITWRNKTLDLINQIIREIVFETDQLDKIMINEKLLIDSPVTEGKRTVLHVNDEVIVKKISKKSIVNNVTGHSIELSYYIANVEYVHFGLRFNHDIKILHENSEQDFQKILDRLKSVALSKKQGTKAAKIEWIRYYDFFNKFTRIKYSYCITTHKSQGSTYENVILMNQDINFNRKIQERNKLKYTAMTRASKNLHIFNDML